jgi:hypothetical protein
MAAFPGHALVVGVGAYAHAPALRFPAATADARAVAQALRDPAAGYPERQVALLCDSSASRAGILKALDDLAARAATDDTVVLFYSGYGQRSDDGAYHLAAVDTRFTNHQSVADGTAIHQDELLDWLRRLKARRVLLVFDAGHAGVAPAVLSIDDAPSAGVALPAQLAAALLATGEGRAVLSACREGQRSYAGAGSQSLFGQALLAGLRGEGSGSQSGSIGIFDLYSSLFRNVTTAARERYGAAQEPELTLLKGAGPFAIALRQGATATLSEPGTPGPSLDGMAVREVEQADSETSIAPPMALPPEPPTALPPEQGEAPSDVVDRGAGISTGGQIDDQSGESVNRSPAVLGIEESPQPIPAGIPKAPVGVQQQRRLEAAMPRSAHVGRPTEIRVMIAQPPSEGLRRFLPAVTESGDVIRRDDVAGQEVMVEFENEQSTTLYLELDAPDFEFEQALKPLRVPRASDSGVATFFVTPRYARSDGRVVVNLYQDSARQAFLGSLTLMVDIRGRSVGMFFEEVWQIVTSSVGGARRQGLVAVGATQQVVYYDMRNQTVIQGDQYNLSGNFQGSNVNIKSTLSNASQSVGTLPSANQADKDELQRLLQQLNAALQQAPSALQAETEALATLARQLLDMATQASINPATVQIAAEGLRQASEQLAGALPAQAPIVAALIAQIQRMAE